ncbi:TPA: helix-turn-helix domain-containing protein [Vibrio cholerae]|nr:helix-turn-helix transcriptional regulator [Vibrio cholerae]
MFSVIKINNKNKDVKYITFKKPSIIWIEKGECEVLYRNESSILTHGSILTFNKNKRIRIKNKSCDSVINVISLIKVPDINVLSSSYRNSSGGSVRCFSVNSNFKNMVVMLDYINNLKFDALGREFIVDIFYKYLKDFGLLHTMFDYTENKDAFLGTDERVYDYLLSLLPEEQVIKNACLYFNISRSTLIRRLKKCNTTFKNIVRECRMDAAKEIIETKNLDIEHVSMIVGYQSKSKFLNHFFEKYGITPMELSDNLNKKYEVIVL